MQKFNNAVNIILCVCYVIKSKCFYSGLTEGHISKDYILLSSFQCTSCTHSDALYKELKKWDHFCEIHYDKNSWVIKSWINIIVLIFIAVGDKNKRYKKSFQSNAKVRVQVKKNKIVNKTIIIIYLALISISLCSKILAKHESKSSFTKSR